MDTTKFIFESDDYRVYRHVSHDGQPVKYSVKFRGELILHKLPPEELEPESIRRWAKIDSEVFKNFNNTD